MKLATRPRGTGGGPRAARELTPLPTGVTIIFSFGRVSSRKTHFSARVKR